MRRLLFLLLAFPLLIVGGGCGVKGNPTPYVKQEKVSPTSTPPVEAPAPKEEPKKK